jgi:acetyl-CoA C-acetyltransferase
MNDTDVVVAGYARTPFGRFFGALRDIPAHRLGALAIDELLRRTGVDPGEVDGLYAGVGMASGGVFTPAREAVLASQLPDTTPSLAVDRACCSGMTAIGLAWRELAAGGADLLVCGGFESLSRTPLLAARARRTRPGDPAAVDPAAVPYDPLLLKSPVEGKAIADYTGEEALAHGVTREMQDEWAAQSHARYFAAEAAGVFDAERFEVAGLATDEGPRRDTTAAQLASLPTIYASPTVTAGNAPGLSDGAAFLLLATAKRAARLGLPVLARVAGYAQVAGEPTSGSYTPALAIRALMKAQGRAAYEIDLLEINEAYAATPLVSTLRLGSRNPEMAAELRGRTNVHGGAVAVGHPLGASGARIAMTLVNALGRRGGGRGIAAICGGYGQGDAVMVEVAGESQGSAPPGGDTDPGAAQRGGGHASDSSRTW